MRAYKVKFHEPVNGKRTYYFRQQTGIFEMFTSQEVGITLGTLYVKGKSMTEEDPLSTKKCTITPIVIIDKKEAK